MSRAPLLLALLLVAGCGNGNGNVEAHDYLIAVTDHEDALTPNGGDMLCWIELTRAPNDLTVEDLLLTASIPNGDTTTLLIEHDGATLAVGGTVAAREAGVDEFDQRTVDRSVIIGFSVQEDRGLVEVANAIWTPEN